MKMEKLPDWAWWREPAKEMNPRFAAAILQRAGEFELKVFNPTGAPLDRAVQDYQRGNKKMGSQDRLLLGVAVYALMRNREVLRAGFPAAPLGEGRLLLLALLDARQIPPAEIPNLPGHPKEWLAALKRVAAQRHHWLAQITKSEGQLLRAPARAGQSGEMASAETLAALAGLFVVPPWWLADGPWLTVGEAVQELAVLKKIQRLVLRVQINRGTREQALNALADLNIPVFPTIRSPWGIIVDSRHNVMASPLYRDGLIEVQDEGSQLVACLCDPKPNEKVLDLCAGGGGKTLALAALMKNKGQVVATDNSPQRLAQAKLRARRAGLGNIQVTEKTEEVAKSAPYDIVLVDAPCSSSGTLRRNPDVSMRWKEGDVARLTEKQVAILDRAAGLVKPGGFLVYATCSILPRENEEQAAAFAGRHPEFTPAPPGDRAAHTAFAGVPHKPRGYFRLAANLADYSGDAFFLARWQRRQP